jgi:hypothetical protein
MHKLLIAPIVSVGGATIMSGQDTPADVQKQIDELKKQKELLDTEKAK